MAKVGLPGPYLIFFLFSDLTSAALALAFGPCALTLGAPVAEALFFAFSLRALICASFFLAEAAGLTFKG